MSKSLNKMIKEARLACDDTKGKKLSLIEKMRPYVHLNNLLMIKFQRLTNDKKHNKQDDNGKRWE